MAKGYMIFVEGGGTPDVIHATFDAALWNMKQLAEKSPGKEVFLFALHKRCVNRDGVTTRLPCHIPADFKNPERLRLDMLVHKKDLKPETAA
ncbi:MAG TPA: hypothetical protein VHW09_27105 [Bryobacteraceae bacterium]|jgi:hypothetical protein|nr:hypothetical protein [Bryobacteraceae bacterium]